MQYRSHDRPAAARSHGHEQVRSLPTPHDVRPIRSTTDAATRYVAPAEAAQARLFEGILRAEIAEMLNLPAHAREEARARIQELDRLIRALRNRFPGGAEVATPPGQGVHSSGERTPRAVVN